MDIKPGLYRHYKGGLYTVLYEAIHSETLEKMVVYTPCKEDADIWVRPSSMFLEKVLLEGHWVSRFSFLD